MTAGWRLFSVRVLALILVVLSASSSFAYSVLTHEEIVDLAWTDEIRPLLLKRFQGLSEEQITEAHAYATRTSSISHRQLTVAKRSLLGRQP